jgi:hypothetical protein
MTSRAKKRGEDETGRSKRGEKRSDLMACGEVLMSLQSTFSQIIQEIRRVK